jgi:hypothetical protein
MHLRNIIDDGDDFHNNGGTFVGRKWAAGDIPSKGQMPIDEYRIMSSVHMTDRIDYVIWSYNTVIAYRASGVWYQPKAYYSNTTSFHQSRTRTATSQLRVTNAA